MNKRSARQAKKLVGKTQSKALATSGGRFTADSFVNFEARVGIGTANQSTASSYSFDYISRNRTLLEAMYRSSWIVGMGIDVIAEDMTRAGIDLSSTLPPDDQQMILVAMDRMCIWDRLCDTIKWSRLYGGAIAVLLVDGQRMDTPLKPDSIGPGQFKGLTVMDRWMVMPSLNDLVQEYGPDLGTPRFYEVIDDSFVLRRQRIHYSRVIRMDGVDLPYWQKVAENLWGQSVIERLFDRLLAFDSTTQGAAQLVYKAHLRTYKVKGLRDIISTGGAAYEGLVKQVESIRRFQTNEGLSLTDTEDEMETHSYAFSGLSDVLLQFGQQLSGALQIPLVRLFGQSPAGLNATGEGDMKQYHENINQRQERRLRGGIVKLLDLICRSELKQPPPDDLSFEFNPLEEMSDTEKAEVAERLTKAVIDAYDAGLIDCKTALKELRQIKDVCGVWSNIDDELIKEAENDPPPMREEPPNADPDTGQTTSPPRRGEGP